MKKLFWRLTLSYVVSLMAVAIFYFRFQSESHVLWPNPDSLEHPRIYTDLREGGFSTAEFLEKDSVLAIQAILNSGIYHPHAGAEFRLLQGVESLSLQGVDFSNIDSVAITFRSNADIALVFYTVDPKISKVGDVLSLRPVRLDIPATRYYTEHRLPLSRVRTNPIWFDMQGVEPDSLLYLDHVAQVAVETGKGALLGLPTEIEIQKLEFLGTNRCTRFLCLIILVLVTGIYLWGILKIYGKPSTGRKDARWYRLGKYKA